jgi:hypothetical protein
MQAWHLMEREHHLISCGPATAKKERRPRATMASPPEEDAIRAVCRPATERCQQANPRLCDCTQVRQCQAISDASDASLARHRAVRVESVDELIRGHSEV